MGGCDVLIMAEGSRDATVWRGCPDRQSQNGPVIYSWVAGSITNVTLISDNVVLEGRLDY